MGMFCSIWGCSDEPIDFWGDNAEYVLYRCKRCRKETIFCSKELKVLDNNDEGRKVMAMMMKDAEFSRQCRIHSEFSKAETDNPFSWKKQEQEHDRIRENYGLPTGFRQPDPIILFQKGLWKPKPGTEKGESKERKPKAKTSKSKPKSKDRPIELQGGENVPNDPSVKITFVITNNNEGNRNRDGKDSDVPGFTYDGENSARWDSAGSEKAPKMELSLEAQIERLKRREKKHVDREEYEKAAKMRDQIIRLQNGNK